MTNDLVFNGLIKAFRSHLRVRSFFLALIFISSNLFAAEVTRSLSLEDRVRILEQQLASANRMRAESQFEITNLKNEVRNLLGMVEEQGYQLNQIVTRQRELYRDIDDRLNKASSQPAKPIAALNNSTQTDAVVNVTEVNPDIQNNVDSSTPSIISQAEPIVSSEDKDIRSIYSSIFPLVNNKEFDQAIEQYKQFITNYPSSIYVANSRYWLAQIYVIKRMFVEAETEYLIVAEQYKTSEKAAEAWFKLGKLYEHLTQTDKAINAYNQVITQYGDSTTIAQMSIKRLQLLKSN